PAAASQPAAPEPPRIAFERTIHDFGRILDVENYDTTFQFTNDGDETLVIERISASPGCVVSAIEGDEFGPGESGEVKVRFEPMVFGPHKKFVDVHSNARPSGFTRLTLAADVQPLVSPDPRFLNLGAVAFGEEHRSTVQLSCERGEFAITSVRTTHPNLSTDVDTAPGGARPLEVVIGADAPWGSFGGWVEIESVVREAESGETRPHKLRIPVQAAVLGELIPQPLTFRVTSNTGEVWRAVSTLRHRVGRPFTVLDVSVAGDQLGATQVTSEEQDDGGWKITLSGEAPNEAATVQGAVIVVTDVENESELAIPVFMQIRGAAKP
ncbi:MAG: DUF1573 domain-containing protein, partial [Planctomycetota bacterium]